MQYQGKNENRNVKNQNGDGFGTSLTYHFGGSDFAISGAYTNSIAPTAEPAKPWRRQACRSVGYRSEIQYQ
ncbi:porin [Shigella flexneri]